MSRGVEAWAARQKFMEDYDVIPQLITPMLSQSGLLPK
jgi:hypothetical protein